MTLSSCGFVIVSGLAFGVDAAAHEGCLDANGATVAILPCGLDRVYPRSHERLAKKIVERGGALVSEYPPGTEPLPYRFLERNRIVSGISRGIIVVEAPEGSGAVATARFAGEQGRDIFVVPGPATHPNYVASHELIRNGAELAATPEHVLETYNLLENRETSGPPEREMRDLSPDERSVLLFLREHGECADVDKIIEHTTLQPQAANIALSFLVIKGAIKETANGYVSN
jgi:DNA processing protein